MAWETFTNRRTRTSSKAPTLTIGQRGIFTINLAAHQALDEPDAVELLYDRDEQIVGLRAADPAGPNSYAVRPTNGARSFVISGGAFCRYYRIPIGGEARRRAATFEDGILCVDLKDPGIPVTSNRAKQDPTG